MSDTPLIDAAIRAGCLEGHKSPRYETECLHPDCDDCATSKAIVTALRAAFPREPTPETIEAMARAMVDSWLVSDFRDRQEYIDQNWKLYKDSGQAAYHAIPIVADLWPEEE